MQSISPVTISDFQEKGKVVSNKLEIFIDPDWIDLCSLAGENYMISANYSSGPKKMSYKPIAASFTAIIDDTDGDFNPENTAGLYKTYLKVGRLIRFWTGFEVSGTPQLWQWFEGVISDITIDRANRQISIIGSDFTQYLIDIELKSPGNYWGDDVTKSTVADQVGYEMPGDCNGVYIAYLDGTQIYNNIDWVYDPNTNKFIFFPSKMPGSGLDLVIYYYTDQVPEEMIADILVYVGLYVDRTAALFAMDYLPTGASEIIERARFNSGVSCLYAIQKICERVDYEFFFSFDSTPIFKSMLNYDPVLKFSTDQTPLDEIDIWLAISSGGCTIDWGDGNTTAATGAGGTNYSHDYTVAGEGTYNIVIYGQTKNITDFRCYIEPISGDIAQFRMLTNLTYLYLNSTSVSGDIADLSGLTLLTDLRLYNTSVSGDIANLSGLTNLTRLYLYNTSVSGDIANLSGLTNLIYLQLHDTSVNGDIANLSGLTNLIYLYLYSTSVSGDIANLSGLTNLTRLYLYNTSVDTYTQGTLPDWEGTTIWIQNLGLDQAEVSDFLVDLNNATGSPGNGILLIHGTNAIPNAAGLTAKGLLEGKGWSITVST